MKTLRRFGALLVLLVVLSVTAFAGETNSPPCTPGEVNSPPCTAPGETSAPPGEGQMLGNSTNPGEMQTPPLSGVVTSAIGFAFDLAGFW